MRTKKLTLIAMLSALALIIFTVEGQIPPIVPLPGIKLGLANIVTLTALYLLGRKEAFAVLILRIVLSSVFAGTVSGLAYSIAGGLVSFLCMGVMSLFFKEKQMWIVSEFGAIGHNIGQIMAAGLMIRNVQIVWYLPVLMISALITGFFTGITAQFTFRQLHFRKDETNA